MEPEKRKKLIWSMAALAVIVVGAGLATALVTGYFRSQDPIYQCIGDPNSQPFQLSVPVTVSEDGIPVLVKKGIGIDNGCTKPVHTLEENVIHVAYSRPHPFTVGHFLYNWQIDLSKYETKVYVNGAEHTDGSFLDIVLEEGMQLRIEFQSRN